jgi:prepilin-type N-terminal cleavage/methylation domain-containing protein
MAIRRHVRAGGRRGFTLVELLVAVGLTSLLLWGLLQLYTSATRFSAAMFTEAELCAGGRAVLDLMCRELTGAATRDIGYIKITDGCQSIQFIAPVGQDDQLAHVKYHVATVDGEPTLHRGIKEPVQSGDSQDTSVTDTQSLGVAVESFKILRIDETTGGEPVQSDHTYPKDTDPSDGVDPLPRAILIEVQIVDPKGQAAITLSSGAYLAGSGI